MKKKDSRYSIVICDDDRFVVSSINKQLEDAEYDIAGTAANGLELIKLCKEKRPDIAIVDIEMPVMNGIEATKELAEENLTKCVVVLTSFDDPEYIQGAIDAGASGYLTKPVNSDVLLPTLESSLRKSGELYEINKKVANINKRIETREIIEKAQLLLMEKHEMSEADAYGYIKKLSKERNTSMADIAKIIIVRYEDN